MKILIVHNAYQQLGGEDAVVEAETKMLRDNGHEVQLLRVSNHEIQSIKDKIETFLSVHDSKSGRAAVGQAIDEFGPKIVHIHNFFPLFSPSIHDEAHRRGVFVVQTLHNYRLLCVNGQFLRKGVVCERCVEHGRLNAITNKCYRGSVLGSLALVRMQRHAEKTGIWQRQVDRFIALTEFSKSRFIKAGFDASKISVKPNFLSLAKGDIASGSLNRSGALFVGRLSVEKGILELVKAWKSFPNYELKVVGDGPLRSELESLAPANVKIIGRKTSAEVVDIMGQAKVLIVPSIWYEGFPMTVIEAFQNKLPVIASDIGSLSEIIQHDVNGLKFKPGDMESLSACVNQIMEGSLDSIRLSGKAYSDYLDNYTDTANYKMLMGIYEGLINSSPTSPCTRRSIQILDT